MQTRYGIAFAILTAISAPAQADLNTDINAAHDYFKSTRPDLKTKIRVIKRTVLSDRVIDDYVARVEEVNAPGQFHYWRSTSEFTRDGKGPWIAWKERHSTITAEEFAQARRQPGLRYDD